jgi:hypothetical protein
MNQMLPYALTGLLAVIFLISLILVVRNLRKSLSDIYERLMSADKELEDMKKVVKGELEDIKKATDREINDFRKALDGQSTANSEEISSKIAQVKEDIRTALKTYIESIIKKITENDAAQKSRFDSLSSQFADLQRKYIQEAARPVENAPEIQASHQDTTAQSTQSTQQAPASPPKQQTPSSDDANAKARRLARLIVSDIALYNRKNVERGVKEGNFLELLEHDIKEARSLYARRVSEEIRNSTSYLDDAFQELFEKTKQELNL